MKSSPESLNLFCKYFQDLSFERENSFVNEIRTGAVSLNRLTIMLKEDAKDFNSGKIQHRNKKINPDKDKYQINLDDIKDLAKIYFDSVKGKSNE